MKMTIMSTTTLLIFLLAMVSPAIYGAEITVGDNSGWTRPFDYDTWAATQNFTVGDTLLFNYDSSHRLDVVNKAAYDNCGGTSNPISTHDDGKTKITLSQPGPMYFICPVPGHCSNGMKLQITVVAATTTSPSGSPPATSPTTPSPPSTSNGPNSPPTTTTPPPLPPSGAGSSIVCNVYTVGLSLVLVALVALMG